MYKYVRIYIHTYIHKYIHTYMHTYIHTYIHTYTHTYIRIYIHTHILTYIHKHKQVLCNSLDLVKLIANACNRQVNLSNVEGFSPLHYSAGEGNLEISKYLVEECSADTQAQDKLGLTPAFCAVYKYTHTHAHTHTHTHTHTHKHTHKHTHTGIARAVSGG